MPNRFFHFITIMFPNLNICLSLLVSLIFVASFLSANSDVFSLYHKFLEDDTLDSAALYSKGKKLFKEIEKLNEIESIEMKKTVADRMHRLAAQSGDYVKATFWMKKYCALPRVFVTPEMNDLRIYYEFNALVNRYPDTSFYALPQNVLKLLGELQQNISHYKYCIEESVPKSSSNGYCRFSTRNLSHHFILSPLKEEILSIDPVVVLFHDIIRVSEVEDLKRLSTDKLASARVINDRQATGAKKEFFARRTQTAWVQSNLFPSLNNRLAAASNLNLDRDAAESYQVAYYTTGGLYTPHYDFIDDNAKVRKKVGQRLATILLYLNDVPSGGATVFPRLHLRVTPLARSALFWYNSFRGNESGTDLSLHGACPVLDGEKWAVNKWVLSRGQERSRPCGLNPGDPFVLTDFDKHYYE